MESTNSLDPNDHRWMIRTSENYIIGPLEYPDFREILRSRQLAAQDEICPSNGYWFALYEQEEVAKHLQIESIIDYLKPTDVPTEAELTATELDKTIPEIDPPPPVIAEPDHLRNRALWEFQKTRKSTETLVHKPQVQGHIEKMSIWKGLLWTLVVFLFCLTIALIKTVHK